MDEDLLLPFFSEFGPVAELTVIRDKVNQTHKGAPAITIKPNISLTPILGISNEYYSGHTLYYPGCAVLTYCMQQSARRAVDQLHDKIKLPNVR